jgi:hypothetical protein
MSDASVVFWLVWRVVRLLVLAVLGTGVVMYVYFWGFGLLRADSLLFQPAFCSYEDDGEVHKIEVGDGVVISARWLPSSNGWFTVFHHHGNAEDLGFLGQGLGGFEDRGFSVFAYDYRGYGTSSGEPSVEGVYRDAEAAFRYLVEVIGVPPERILVHGRSVGSGPAVDIAVRHPVAGLVVESGFVSAFRVVTRIPLFPGDKFRNLARIRDVGCPVLVLHGTADETIPVWHGRALYERAREPKRAVWIEGAGHDDLLWVGKERYWGAWGEFAELCGEPGS